MTDYNAADCLGYDTNTGNITGTITVKNKKMQPLSPSPEQTVAQHIQVQALMYHSILRIDTNAGTAGYSLLLQKQAKEPEKVHLMVQFLR